MRLSLTLVTNYIRRWDIHSPQHCKFARATAGGSLGNSLSLLLRPGGASIVLHRLILDERHGIERHVQVTDLVEHP